MLCQAQNIHLPPCPELHDFHTDEGTRTADIEPLPDDQDDDVDVTSMDPVDDDSLFSFSLFYICTSNSQANLFQLLSCVVIFSHAQGSSLSPSSLPFYYFMFVYILFPMPMRTLSNLSVGDVYAHTF